MEVRVHLSGRFVLVSCLSLHTHSENAVFLFTPSSPLRFIQVSVDWANDVAEHILSYNILTSRA